MEMLESARMVLDRSRKHQVWKHPDGRSFTMSSTPSDSQAVHQQIRSLRKFLGLARPVRHRNPERKPKKGNHERPGILTLTPSTIQAKPTWQGQLAEVAKEITTKPSVAAVVEPAKPKQECKGFTPDVWEALNRHGIKVKQS